MASTNFGFLSSAPEPSANIKRLVEAFVNEALRIDRLRFEGNHQITPERAAMSRDLMIRMLGDLKADELMYVIRILEGQMVQMHVQRVANIEKVNGDIAAFHRARYHEDMVWYQRLISAGSLRDRLVEEAQKKGLAAPAASAQQKNVMGQPSGLVELAINAQITTSTGSLGVRSVLAQQDNDGVGHVDGPRGI